MMKRTLTFLFFLAISSLTWGADYWVSVEVNREDMFPIQDAEYLKTLLRAEYDFLNEMNVRNLEGNTNWYDFEISVESWDERILSAQFYKPGDPTPIPMKKDGSYEFYFDSDDVEPIQFYVSLNELAVDYPAGTYQVEIVFPSGTVVQDVVVPDYNTVVFPGDINVALTEDAAGQLIVNWNTVPDINEYEVWAESIRGGRFFDAYDEDVNANFPDVMQTPTGLSKSKADYQLGIWAVGDQYWQTNAGVEFSTDVTVFSFKKPPAVIQNEIQKCSVRAGRSADQDSIQFSGLLDAIEAHFLMAMGGDVVVTVDADNMPDPLEWVFPIDEVSLKRGKYNYSRKENASQSSFKFDTKNGKMLFAAKNVDLTGLACPATVTVTIGAYSADIELVEDIVNGSRMPCPPQFLRGVLDWMMVDKVQVRFGKKPGTDSFSINGFFTILGVYDKLNPMVASLDEQTFTVSGSQFVNRGYSESCNKGTCEEGPQIKAKFDFAKCTFQIQVSNAVIDGSGEMDFGINCFGNELPEQDIDIQGMQRYELERYRCYNQFGRDWTYSANYSLQDSEGLTNSSGTTSGTVSVASIPVTIDGHPCFSVSSSTPDATVSSTWYEDYYGMHMYSWGNANDMVSFDTEMDALLAMPTLLSVGQTHKTSGTFTGEYNLDLGPYSMDIDIYDFKGKASIITTLLGFEPVTVPYGSYANAAKVQVLQTLDGSMMVEVDYYGQILRARLRFKATIDQIWWGVEDMGVVKSSSDMLIKMSGGGENIWVSMTETDQLTGYNP